MRIELKAYLPIPGDIHQIVKNIFGDCFTLVDYKGHLHNGMPVGEWTFEGQHENPHQIAMLVESNHADLYIKHHLVAKVITE